MEIRTWIFRNWVELRRRVGRFRPKGLGFVVLRIWEAFLQRFQNQAWIKEKMSWFLSRFLVYNGVFSQIGTIQSLHQHDLNQYLIISAPPTASNSVPIYMRLHSKWSCVTHHGDASSNIMLPHVTSCCVIALGLLLARVFLDFSPIMAISINLFWTKI